MKVFKFIIPALILGLASTSCREENTLLTGEGRLTLTTSVMSEIKVVSRSLTDEQKNSLASSALIWVTDTKGGLIKKFNGIGDFPTDGLPLKSGEYMAHVWAGDSVPATWDKDSVRYHGWESFEIKDGGETSVNVKCPVRNALVSVNLGGKIKDVLSDITFTVRLNDPITDGSHSLTFDGEKIGNGTKGYFMPNTRTKGFLWTINGTDNHGKAFTHSGEYKDESESADTTGLAHSTEYVFNIGYDYDEKVDSIGGAYLDIEVDREPVEGTTTDLVIALAPEIVGLDGWDINKVWLGEPGAVGRVSVHVIGATTLKSVNLESSTLGSIENGVDRVDFLNSSQVNLDKLKAGGINFKGFDNRAEKVNGEYTNLRINLEEEFTNSLSDGEKLFTIEATDADGHTTTKSFTINVSKAPGQLTEMSAEDLEKNVSYTSATIYAEIKTPGAENGFEIRATGAARSYEDWTFVKGDFAEDGKTLSKTLYDLQDNTTYEYRLVIDGHPWGSVLSFCTKAYPRLPNSGFEEWQTASSPYLIYASGGEMFWDSGNHGSATMNKNVTVPDGTIKHSGNYSIKLASQFVGVGALGKFAAGNVFIGEYLETVGTNGVLGWGRPWELRPKALKGYVKYTPVAVTSDNSSYAELKKGDMDKGIIYIALLSGENGKDEKYSAKWPVVIRTKSPAQLFDPEGDNVVAYGKKVFDSATGDGMIEFNIPLEDVHGDLEFKNIMIVASASIGGDYFVGGNGSTMWLDDLELIY